MGCVCLEREVPKEEEKARGVVRKNTIVKWSSTDSDYIKVRSLGGTSFGKVTQVKHHRTGEEFAMKTVSLAFLKEKGLTEQFLNEIRCLLDLVSHKQDSPYIMRIYEVIQTDTNIHVVTELLRGQQLFERICTDGVLSEKDAITYFRKFIKALGHLHSSGLVHKHLSPEKLMFTSEEPNASLKLTDFGMIFHRDQIKDQPGLVKFIAPEQLKKKSTEKSDIWAAGLILHCMLTGRLPFDLPLNQYLSKLRNQELQYQPKKVPQLAGDLISKMLSMRPGSRPTAAEVLEHPWLHSDNPTFQVSTKTLLGLSKFNTESKVERVLFYQLGFEWLSREEEEELQRLFESLDVSSDGKIDARELRNYSKSAGLRDRLDVEQILENCDIGKEGSLSYSEFIMASRDWKRMLSLENVRQFIQRFDKNNDGMLSLEELREMLPAVDEAELRAFFAQVDTDDNRLITIAEFNEFLNARLVKDES